MADGGLKGMPSARETFHGRSSLSSLNSSGKGRTEEGETGAEHFIGTASCLPSDADSAVLLDFVAVVDVSDRCRAFLMRSSNSSFPRVQLENPLFLGCGRIERFLQQVNGSHGVYAEGGGFCLSWGWAHSSDSKSSSQRDAGMAY